MMKVSSKLVRMHNNQKLKSSLSLVPDASSAREHINRAELQCYIWRQCLQQTIDYPSPVNRGCEDSDNGLRPVWYLCSQLSPSILRGRKQKAKCGDHVMTKYQIMMHQIIRQGKPKKTKVLQEKEERDMQFRSKSLKILQQNK